MTDVISITLWANPSIFPVIPVRSAAAIGLLRRLPKLFSYAATIG